MAVTTIKKTNQAAYCTQQCMQTNQVYILDAGYMPLMIAYDRARMIDEVVVRFGAVPTIYTELQITRAASGTADTSSTAMGANTYADFFAVGHVDINIPMDLYNLSSQVTNPRLLDKGETLFLFLAASVGDGLRLAVYIRWHDADDGTGRY